MPHDDLDPEDPHALVGVAVPVTDAALAQEALARGLVEEFVRLGFDADSILDIFRTRFYAGAHQIYEVKGDAYVRELIAAANRRYCPLSTT
jgi:hypothetical protein